MLPLASVERIARKAGVERISAEALKEIAKTAEEIADEFAKDVVEITLHAKRRTIKKDDIRLAAGKI